MSKILVISVGTGEGIIHGIQFSITQNNPDYIIFLTTKESSKNIPLIVKEAKIKEYKEVIIEDENDVEEIKLKCEEILKELLQNFESREICVDYTSGTKAMSAGLVLASIEKRIGSLVYISGKRDKNGRVISGTERMVSLEPNRVYILSTFREIIQLFNTYQFDMCLKKLSQIKQLLLSNRFQENVDFFSTLCEIYLLWDKFNIKEAFKKICQIFKEKSEKIEEWRLKNVIEKNRQALYKEKENPFCIERIADLLENARRRGDVENKYDDAAARLYRCLEYISQFHIAQRGLYKLKKDGSIDTEDLDITKLPENLRPKYIRYADPNDGKIKLSLYKNYELLFELGDKVGEGFIQHKENLKKLLHIRNNSILAHGFIPISEEHYKKMLSEIESFLKKIFPNIDSIRSQVRFPKITYLPPLF